jgi:hypothetical protein
VTRPGILLVTERDPSLLDVTVLPDMPDPDAGELVAHLRSVGFPDARWERVDVVDPAPADADSALPDQPSVEDR